MITPGYSVTATERVLPRMMLDFTTASLDSRVTVTRALNTATRVNSSGYIETVNANLPRFDFSPTSIGTCRGLLIEESRVNSVPYSQDYGNAVWSTTRAAKALAAITSPNGVADAYTLTEDSSNSTHFVRQTLTVTAGATYTLTAFLKQNTRTWALLYLADGGYYFDLAAGVAGSSLGSGVSSPIITPWVDGWYRCGFTIVPSTASRALDIYTATGNNGVSYQGNGTSGIYIGGTQLELGAFATSYIPNATASPITRNADVVSMTGTNFSDWFNASQGAVFAEYIKKAGTGNNARVVSFGPFSAGSFASIAALGSNRTGWYAAGLVGLGTATDGVVNRQCIAYTNAGAFLGSINGGSPIVSASSDFTGVGSDTLWLGTQSTGANYLNSHLCKVMYWPQRLTNAEVQAFSK